ncbi:DUF2523 domain-containing protein [Acidovorax sp. SUPP2825]|uniref:DUF2523 domain-containing protein n=1 Tax=Acidovorax sp. SUPP2825 TaxID=2920879 RepID=UPI0023DE3D80|nr:DUF2523 domain-containing protein [Acidovorax sp. SUPP2825]GKS96153.1 DUF2523 domain-containing protein [Acidovorax sp. SUPP2825]
MPWIVSVLLGGLMQIAGSMVGRVLIALGFGFVEYTGVSYLIDQAKTAALSMFGTVGTSMLAEWAGFLRLDQHISIVISAIGVKVLLNSLGGSTVRRLVQK